MSKELKGKIVRLRWVKNYKEACNHVAIGKVIEENYRYLMLEGKTFHFRSLVNINGTGQGVRTGDLAVRVIPWSMIEVLHVLPKGCDFANSRPLFDDDGNLYLNNKQRTIISSKEVY